MSCGMEAATISRLDIKVDNFALLCNKSIHLGRIFLAVFLLRYVGDKSRFCHANSAIRKILTITVSI